MLCLTRKVGERILIGHDTWVCVVEIRGGKVRLGIDAPADINIVRGELIEHEQRSEVA